MSLGVYTTWSVVKAVDLANLFSHAHGPIMREDLLDIVDRQGLDAAELRVEDLRPISADIRGVFAVEGDRRVERINTMLERYAPSPRIVQHGGQELHFHYTPPASSPAEHLGSSFAVALAVALVEQEGDRFGWCDAPGCDRMYFDRSRSRSQRFCCKSCATRVHVAAHRARS